MATWTQRQQEVDYLSQLDTLILKRLQRSQNLLPSDSRAQTTNLTKKPLSILSREINEELDRLEDLLTEELETTEQEANA